MFCETSAKKKLERENMVVQKYENMRQKHEKCGFAKLAPKKVAWADKSDKSDKSLIVGYRNYL